MPRSTAIATTLFESITTDAQLEAYCRQLKAAQAIAFDTEFVAENTFRPVLCQVQVAADGQLAVIDPVGITDIRPFWEALAQDGHSSLVHSGRGEVEFCLQAVGRPPANLFDVQLAAGLAGVEYPAGLSTLLTKLLGRSSKKHETRTDWRRRPLSSRQIEYALDDVRFLQPLRDALQEKLSAWDRLDWLHEETETWLAEIQRAMTEQRWWKVSGNTNLNPRGLAIVRELWRWRQAEAERRDRPPRTVLRDDLIIEMARRQTADLKQVQAVRGMEWGKLRRQLPEIVAAIELALATPEKECPPPAPRDTLPQLAMLGQFLSAALTSLCRQRNLAASLVGTPSDVRDLILYRTGQHNDDDLPHLAHGWRAQVVGRLFEDLLDGKMAIRITDPSSEHPLAIEPVSGNPSVVEATPD